jgi:hypothetical protein
MAKITSFLKEYSETIEEFIFVIFFFGLIFLSNLDSANATEILSESSVCKEVTKENYTNISILLEPNSSLGQSIITNDNLSNLTGEQIKELSVITARCSFFSTLPFFEEITGMFDLVENFLQPPSNS